VSRGDDGRWFNDTGRWAYQLVSSLRRPCRHCITLHGQIGPDPWPPQHPNCECESLEIPPGSWSPLPVSELSEVLARLDGAALAQLLGAEATALLDVGLVGLSDLVTPDGDFVPAGEIVRRRGWTRERLVAAGVPPGIAERLAGPPS